MSSVDELPVARTREGGHDRVTAHLERLGPPRLEPARIEERS